MSKDLTQGAIGPWLFRLTTPMVMGIFSIFLFNIVDTYFISMLGTQPLAAISFTFPITMLVMNVAIGLSIATGALVARSLGQKDLNKAKYWVTCSVYFSLIIGLILGLAGTAFLDPLFKLLGASDELMPFIQDYMVIWFLGSVCLMMMIIINASLRATGNTKLPSFIMLGSALLNGILDPLLIFGIGPFPRLEVQGAAIATLISWVVALAFVLHKLHHDKLIELAFPQQFRDAIKKISSLAIPAAATNMLGPFASAILIAWVAEYGTHAVAAYGVGSRLEPIALIVIFAFTASLPPFVGQNHGAKQYLRIEEALRKSMMFIFVWQLVIYSILALAAKPLSQLFSDELEVQKIIQLFIYIVPLSYIGLGFCLVSTATINALHKTRFSLQINIVRLFVLYLPFAWLGKEWGGLQGLFIGCAIGNVLIGLAIVLFFRHVRHSQTWQKKLLASD